MVLFQDLVVPRLPRLIGKGRALYYLLTGEMVDASKALEMGLVCQVVPSNQLLDRYIQIGSKDIDQISISGKACNFRNPFWAGSTPGNRNDVRDSANERIRGKSGLQRGDFCFQGEAYP